jgi:hypothetical protein
MATNPTITPYGTATQAYTVGASDVAYFDIEVSNLTTGAEFFITAPTGAEVHAWRLASNEAIMRWNPAGIEQTLRGAGTAWQASVTLGNWQLAIQAGAAPTDPALVTVTSAAAAGGPLRVRIRDIRAGGAGATATLDAESNAATRRILADPSIIGTPGPTALPVLERTLQTLVGSPAVSAQQQASVPAVFGTQPAVRGAWERVTSTLAFTLAPSGTANATFTTPGVHAPTPESFRFRAYYDLLVDTVFTAGEPDNTEDVNVTIEPAHHRLALVLDRSGSMTSPAGASTSKWAAALQASHAWLDLMSAFRAPAGHKAGFETFEDDVFGYGPCAPAADVTFRDPANGAAAPGLSDLVQFANLNALNLGAPQTMTPIGDALSLSFKALVTPPLQTADVCTVFLATDGLENSGCVTVKPVSPPGVTKTVASELVSQAGLKAKVAFYALAIGDSVDEDAIDGLPALGGRPGYYRLTNTTTELLSAFGQMIGHSVGAADLGATINNASPPGPAAFFKTNAGERRLVVVVTWTSPAATETLQLSHRTQGSNEPWTALSVGSGSGTTLTTRATHALMAVELATALSGLPSTARDWKVERLDTATSPATAKAVDAALAVVDLHVDAQVSFDKQAYATGEPMIISCTVLAGKEPVLGATVVVEGDAPATGLGSYLAINGAKVAGPVSVSQIGHGKLSDLQSPDRGDEGGRQDPHAPKKAILDHYLALDGLNALPRANAVFEDGTDRLHDDGAHHDGAADDGVYANRYIPTKEGTVTLRFHAEGTLPDGSEFSRVITVSKWVGVDAHPPSSPVVFTAVAQPPAGFVGQVISITPRDANGEYVGPFRENRIGIEADAGSFDGPVDSLLDGSYTRTLLHRREENPTITVTVDGKPVATRPAKEEGCWKLLWRGIRCLLRKLWPF